MAVVDGPLIRATAVAEEAVAKGWNLHVCNISAMDTTFQQLPSTLLEVLGEAVRACVVTRMTDAPETPATTPAVGAFLPLML